MKFSLFNKPRGKPTKRIEFKTNSKNSRFKIRGSRTGGVNASIHPFRGLTFNTKHGIRLSKTFKGLTLGFQGRNTIFRGRWKIGQNFNLNLSKSGFSASVSSRFGTYNFSNPSRSSFKFAGFQIRGKKAEGWAFLFAIPNIIKGLIVLVINILKLFYWVILKLFYWVIRPILFVLSVALYVVFYFLGIFLKILFFLVSVLVEIFLIWPLGVMHNLASMLLIDMPIYIINNFAGKELFVENEPSYKKIKSKQIEENDRVANELLLERLEFYANKNFKEYSFKEKIFYWILFFFGIFLGILGIFIIVYSISVASWLYAFMGYYLTLIGNEMKEPALRAKRQKEDLILNQEFNLI